MRTIVMAVVLANLSLGVRIVKKHSEKAEEEKREQAKTGTAVGIEANTDDAQVAKHPHAIVSKEATSGDQMGTSVDMEANAEDEQVAEDVERMQVNGTADTAYYPGMPAECAACGRNRPCKLKLLCYRKEKTGCTPQGESPCRDFGRLWGPYAWERCDKGFVHLCMQCGRPDCRVCYYNDTCWD